MSIILKAKNISKQYRLGIVGAGFHPKLTGSFFLVEDFRKVIFVEKNILGFTVINAARTIGGYMGREPGYIKPIFNCENKLV
jgi:hypothetical protein